MQFSDLPDILLITVDTMRRDLMAPYGKDLMPEVTRLAQEGVSFDNCFAASPWTGPSFSSIFTGLWSRQHHHLAQIPRRGESHTYSPMRSDARTLTQMLKDAGYHTMCSQGNATYVGPGTPFVNGFDQFFVWNYDQRLNKIHREIRALTDALAHRRFWQTVAFTSTRILRLLKISSIAMQWPLSDGETLVREAYRMLQKAPSDKPVFLWINLMDVHGPYYIPGKRLPRKEAPAPIRLKHLYPFFYYKGEFNEEDKVCSKFLYDYSAGYVDEQIRKLTGYWKTMRQKRSQLTMFTSDHGEEFWEHGNDLSDPLYYNCGVGHGHTLYNELLRVPLIVTWPGAHQGGRRVDGLTSSTDITPMIAELLELNEDLSTMSGISQAKSVTSVSKACDKGRITFADALHYGREHQAAISRTHKLIVCPETGRKELYAWGENDPEEKTDLSTSPQHAEILNQLSSALNQWNESLKDADINMDLTEEEHKDMANRLSALGYM